MKKFDRSISSAKQGCVEIYHNSTAGIVQLIIWDDVDNPKQGHSSINLDCGEVDDLINLLISVSKDN